MPLDYTDYLYYADWYKNELFCVLVYEYNYLIH